MEIELSEYQENWLQKFEEEKAFLINTIGGWLCGSIEHVGSTAIPGMVAKPIIDIMFGIEDLANARGAIEILESSGYCFYPYKEDVMYWFCKPTPEFRTHHLHLVPFQGELWCQRIRFRDTLKNNPTLAQEYIALKKSLVKKFVTDREAYTQGKWPFVRRIINSEIR